MGGESRVNLECRTNGILHSDSLEYLRRFGNPFGSSLLFESRLGDLGYDKKSVVIPNSVLRIVGKNDRFKIEALTELGAELIRNFSESDFYYTSSLKISKFSIKGKIRNEDTCDIEESERIKNVNTGDVLRTIINKFSCDDDHFGLYGAFAYDFSRNFLNFGSKFRNSPGTDFEFHLPLNILYFDDSRRNAQHKQFVVNGKTEKLTEPKNPPNFLKEDFVRYSDMTDEGYKQIGRNILEDIDNGRLMQCVLSRLIGVSLQKSPIDSYEALREINPSPYSYFLNFGDEEYLYGASPEMQVRVIDGKIEVRPLAGTIRRSDNPMDDYKARRFLMTDEKELREHTMLADLSRRDIYRLCHPNSVQEELFLIEKHPNLYHIASIINGDMRPEFDSIDAILTTLPAGTLIGSPREEAMKIIEGYEKSRRNYYGGAAGFLGMNGNCDLGIVIRSVYVNNGLSQLRFGSGITSLSDLEKELDELKLKVENTLRVVR